MAAGLKWLLVSSALLTQVCSLKKERRKERQGEPFAAFLKVLIEHKILILIRKSNLLDAVKQMC